MARYIDLDKVAEHKNNYCNTTSITHCNRDCVECFYKNGGAEDVAPVVHAKWEWSYHKNESECSNCGHWSVVQSNYCPDCGAKMDKE